ncbi:hypothetical protein E2320_003938, partial [Naja naja]
YIEKGNSDVPEESIEEYLVSDHQSSVLSPEDSPIQTSEAVTGELSKLLDEIKLCQEKDYLEDMSHTISDDYLDDASKVSEEE